MVTTIKPGGRVVDEPARGERQTHPGLASLGPAPVADEEPKAVTFGRGWNAAIEQVLNLVDIDREETCLDWQWGEDRNSVVAQKTFQQIADAVRKLKV